MGMRVVEPRHHEMPLQVLCLRLRAGSAAIEQNMLQRADAKNLFVTYRHCGGPGLLRIIRINVAMRVVGDSARIAFLRKRSANTNQSESGHARPKAHAKTLPHPQCPFSCASPETPSNVSSTRCKPTSRPAGSYHSSSECAPPPLPPAPIAIASIPSDSGMFASVDERSIRDWLLT